MSKAYRKMADQLLSEKVQKEFPDWALEKCKISVSEVSISNDDALVELGFDPDDNSFCLLSITIKPITSMPIKNIVVDNKKLTEIYNTMVKGVKI